MIIELAKLILLGTRITYQANGDADFYDIVYIQTYIMHDKCVPGRPQSVKYRYHACRYIYNIQYTWCRALLQTLISQNEETSAVRSRTSSKPISASCVGYTSIARTTGILRSISREILINSWVKTYQVPVYHIYSLLTRPGVCSIDYAEKFMVPSTIHGWLWLSSDENEKLPFTELVQRKTKVMPSVD